MKSPAEIAAANIAKAQQEADVKRRAERDAARVRYYELIVQDDGTESAAEELAKCAGLIGKSAAEFMADRHLVERSREMVDTLHQLTGSRSALTALEELAGPLEAITKQQIAALEQQQQRFASIVQDARDRAYQFGPMYQKLTEAKQQNPELLASIEVPERTLGYHEKFKLADHAPGYVEWQNSYTEVASVKIKDSLLGTVSKGNAAA
jgi:hypothetical protein